MDAKRLIYRVIATFGFVGYLPLAPGTWGTAAGLLVWFLIPLCTTSMALV